MALTMVVNGFCSATDWSHRVQPRLYLAYATCGDRRATVANPLIKRFARAEGKAGEMAPLGSSQ
jgi:hypothetical protein